MPALLAKEVVAPKRNDGVPKSSPCVRSRAAAAGEGEREAITLTPPPSLSAVALAACVDAGEGHMDRPNTFTAGFAGLVRVRERASCCHKGLLQASKEGRAGAGET